MPITLRVRHFAVLALLLGACSQSGGGEEEEFFFPEPTSNSIVSGLAVVGVSGEVTIRFLVADPESDEVNVAVEYSIDKVNWYEAGIDPPGALATTPEGVEFTVAWDSMDLGFRRQPGYLRVTPRDGDGKGEAAQIVAGPFDNRRARTDAVEFYMIHYGPFDEATLRLAETYQLVILHPWAGRVTAAQSKDIADGVDPLDPYDDVIVLGYISVGEDLRTAGVSDAEMLLDPRFVGDGSGPRMDPRGPDADGDPILGLDPLGAASNGGTGYASFYLDDNSIDRDPGDIGDGKPDRNAIFGGAFVNAGDPLWFEALDDMLFDSPDGMPGIRELLTTTYGRGYGCDGLFMDTIDTCAPNYFTGLSDVNQSEYEWTAKGFLDFIKLLRARYPEAVILQNRGLFFFDPRQPHFEVTTRAHVDYVKYESYRLNSNTFEEFDDYFFPDNKYNVAPKLMAEANRPDGFKVLSLGYAEGPGVELDTLIHQASGGLATLMDDIRENEDLVGFRHYITAGSVAFPNSFVRDMANRTDIEAPRWSSTFNPNNFPWPAPPGAPPPRVGIQEVVAGEDSAIVRFDVALDLNKVSYVCYLNTSPDFVDADRIELDPRIGAGYTQGVGPTTYPHEDTLFDLETRTRYYFCVRAVDAYGNEDQNTVWLSAVPIGQVTIDIDGDFADWDGVPVLHSDPADAPDSNGPDFTDISITNDDQFLYIRYSSENPFNFDGSPGFNYSRALILIDTDGDPATGYRFQSIGSELLVAGSGLYKQAAQTFNDGFLQTLAANPETNVTQTELAIPLSRLGNTPTIRLVLVNDETNDTAPNTGSLTYSMR